MDFEWVAIAFGDVAWISVAFALGLLSRMAGLPTLLGYLAAGFVLNGFGFTSGEVLEKLSDLGITLLLFTVGLKLNLRTLAKPQVWAVTGLHTSVVVILFGFAFYALALLGAPFVSGLDLSSALLVAFALSFSSTVFVVKSLEERGDMASLHGRIAIGVLIMQDIAAVAFLAFSTGQAPSPWVFSVLLLIPLRPFLHLLLEKVGHGELLVLFGFILALGGAEFFESLELKGDLGALVLGVLVASHAKADELAKTMLGFKDVFLLGFFLSIGLSGTPTAETLLIGTLLTPLIFLKSALFFVLMTRFKLRARTSLLASLNLTNFSEFGLIVAAVGVANGWISADWLIIIAISLSLSFIVAAALNTNAHSLYAHRRPFWKRLQRNDLITDDQSLDTKGARVAVIGVDIDPATVMNHRSAGQNVLHGDPSDADFWDRIQATSSLELIMLALPKLQTNLAVLEQIKFAAYQGRVAATAKFQDEVEALEQAGAHTVFNVYAEAGSGFAGHVVEENASGT